MIDPAHQEFRQVTMPSALHTLYPLATDRLHADVIVGSGAGLYKSDSPGQDMAKLVENLHASLNTTPVYSLRGSRDFITSTIDSL